MRRPQTKAAQRQMELEVQSMMADPIPDEDRCPTCTGYIGSNPNVRMTRCVCELRKGNRNGDTPMSETPTPHDRECRTTNVCTARHLSGQLTTRFQELRTKPLTRMTVEAAKELDDDAKEFLAVANASDARKAVNSAYNVHRFLSKMFQKATEPVNEIRQWCGFTLATWERQRR